MGVQRHYAGAAYVRSLRLVGLHAISLGLGPAPVQAMSSLTWSSSVASEVATAARQHHLAPRYPSASVSEKV